MNHSFDFRRNSYGKLLGNKTGVDISCVKEDRDLEGEFPSDRAHHDGAIIYFPMSIKIPPPNQGRTSRGARQSAINCTKSCRSPER